MSEWISVKGRLPDYNDEFLVYTENAKMLVCEYLPYANEWWDCDAFVINNITHWMPLPDPPKEGSETDRGARKYTAGEIKELAKKAFEA